MYEIFEKLLAAREVTAYRVSRETGISTATLTQWKNGTSVPKQDKLQKIADYFDVSVDFLMGREKLENNEIETETQRKVKVMTRKAEEHLTKEEADALAKIYTDTVEMYLKSKGIDLVD
jgi:transcriptional regulator with XRE-family HTH domain